MAPDALLPVKHWLAVVRQPDRLVSAVGAGDLTAPAADAFFPVELWKNDGIALQNISRLADGGQSKPDGLIDVGKAFFGQVIVQPLLQIVDNAVSVLHDRRSDLYASCTEQNKLQRILPGLHAAHRAQMHAFQRRVVS